MPIRWVINPVIEELGSDGRTFRYPKVSRILDPGRPYDVRTWNVYGALQADFSDEVLIEKITASSATTESEILSDYTSDDYPYLYFRAADLGVSIAYKTYGHSSAIGTENWCLSFVRGVNMAALDADAEMDDVLEHDYEDADGYLAETPNSLSWSDNKTNDFKGKFEVKGVDYTGLAKDDQLWAWLQRSGEYVMAGFTPKGTWVK